MMRVETSALRMRPLWRALGWAGVVAVIYLSLTPNPPSIDVAQGDKLGHVSAYAVLALWFVQIYDTRWHIRVAAGLIALGVGMEFAQALTSYRTFELLDMLADAIGVGLGCWLGRTWLRDCLMKLEALVLR